MRILQLVARTMPITNAGVVTVQFSFFPCNYMQLTDIQYQNLKWSPSNPLKDRNPWTKGMRMSGEESNYWRVQETFPCTPSSSSPLPGYGRLARQKQGSIQLMPALPTGPENPMFSFVPLIRRHVLKKWNKQKISGGDLVNTFSQTVCLKQTFMLPPQS